MKNKCLYCYKELKGEVDFHKKCSLEFFGSETPPKLPYSLVQMSELAKSVVERSVAVPGVQPKLSMTLIEEEKLKSDKRLTVVGALGGNFIFKPPSENFVEMPENEHLTMRMAELYGISVVPSSLIRLESGELSYITKRVDRREDGSKIHMIDMFQITEAFDKYKGSMERVGKALDLYASNTLLDKLRFFELTVFSFITGNNDMHLKNFSMIKTNIGWSLSPAYDLLNVTIVNPDDKEEFALTIAGKKRKISAEILTHFGLGLGLNSKQINSVYKRFKKQKGKVLSLINCSFLSEEMKQEYINLLEDRFMKIILKKDK
ncbi:HipA domain-containing protein [Lutibacter sp. A80]|uniref:HipA domain-containing protein n=1 Tax=Lutibacter sp. A80 TaxID=2918453 RepID=UPI001F059AEC|nr:HipA domain-containing protein [Lutibacter sp. A80]UMB61029.1 HipA domain-containing protein [Lutibacter sp. A80]